MKRIGFCLLGVIVFFTFSVHAQSDPNVRHLKEIDRVCDTVVQTHLNDEFYLQIRCFPDIRSTIDDYILKKENGTWKAEHRMVTFDPPPWEDSYPSRKQILHVLNLEENKMDDFLISIDIDRLVQGSKIDSLSLDDSETVFGIDCYAIMICSKGTFKLYEYPGVFHNVQLRRQNKIGSIYWKSAYMDNLITRFTQVLHMKSYW